MTAAANRTATYQLSAIYALISSIAAIAFNEMGDFTSGRRQQ
jgi:hypothetical protein